MTDTTEHAAQTLRRAVSLMRERAEADGSRGWQVEDANEGTLYRPLWMVTNDAFHNPPDDVAEPWLAVEVHTGTRATAKHIASWHPDVALAVADLLTVIAWWIEDEWPEDPDAPMDWESSTGATAERVKAALTLARLYLGEASS